MHFKNQPNCQEILIAITGAGSGKIQIEIIGTLLENEPGVRFHSFAIHKSCPQERVWSPKALAEVDSIKYRF